MGPVVGFRYRDGEAKAGGFRRMLLEKHVEGSLGSRMRKRGKLNSEAVAAEASAWDGQHQSQKGPLKMDRSTDPALDTGCPQEWGIHSCVVQHPLVEGTADSHQPPLPAGGRNEPSAGEGAILVVHLGITRMWGRMLGKLTKSKRLRIGASGDILKDLLSIGRHGLNQAGRVRRLSRRGDVICKYCVR